MRVFIVGAGATGGLLARILHRRGHEVWCGDRDPERAKAFAGERIECRKVNARYYRSVAQAAQGSDLVVNAAPAVFNEAVIRAALQLKVHYLDMAAHLTRNPFKAEQLSYHDQFARRKRLALIGAGAAPGLTNLLVAQLAEMLEHVHRVRVRLFEETESSVPISTWSAEVAHDEAVSKPRVYRSGRFGFAHRFGAEEWFNFPFPIGRTRVVLAAQDEVGTVPHFIKIRDMDVKIGGNEIDRLRRWKRQGKLDPSDDRSEKHFPETVSPAKIANLMRSGKLANARFAACVTASGENNGRACEHRQCCTFPSLHQLKQKPWVCTPVAFAAAQSAAVFVEHLPKGLSGVFPPEALPKEVREAVLRDMGRRGFSFTNISSHVGACANARKRNG
ncbi:MAG TPA: saccharopine dehydrogenase NADP-binding domain-containing protein [Clostridia bacterium]|nr:saccharopine dehydrogenase NADP-binding domain-containing protein [Clostridia bacterium]